VSYVFVLFPIIAVFVSSIGDGGHFSVAAYIIAAAMLGCFALTKLGSDKLEQPTYNEANESNTDSGLQ